MALFLSTAEGRGKPLTKRGTAQTGARGMAGSLNVRAEAGAFFDNPAMGGPGVCLALRLQALVDSGGKADGGVTPYGPFFEMWTGTEAAALELVGAHGPKRQAAAIRQAAKRLEEMARQVEMAPAIPRPAHRSVA